MYVENIYGSTVFWSFGLARQCIMQVVCALVVLVCFSDFLMRHRDRLLFYNCTLLLASVRLLARV
jgi:uncharacterized protein (DUF486 family)